MRTTDDGDGVRATADPVSAGRKQGKFAKGKSGNPRGRPRGSANRATLAARALLDGEAEALTRRAIEMALGGDPTALKLCLERTVPRRRSERVQLTLPPLDRLEDVTAVLGQLLKAATSGDLDLEDAAALAALVDRQRQALASRDLAARVEALEALNARDRQ